MGSLALALPGCERGQAQGATPSPSVVPLATPAPSLSATRWVAEVPVVDAVKRPPDRVPFAVPSAVAPICLVDRGRSGRATCPDEGLPPRQGDCGSVPSALSFRSSPSSWSSSPSLGRVRGRSLRRPWPATLFPRRRRGPAALQARLRAPAAPRTSPPGRPVGHQAEIWAALQMLLPGSARIRRCSTSCGRTPPTWTLILPTRSSPRCRRLCALATGPAGRAKHSAGAQCIRRGTVGSGSRRLARAISECPDGSAEPNDVSTTSESSQNTSSGELALMAMLSEISVKGRS